MTRFDVAFVWIMKAEGGLSSDAHDPGGATKYGISQKSYPDLDIAALTEADARAIYLRDYWKPCRCDELPPGLDLAVFDGAVLQGTQRSIRQLQVALGVKDDGRIGPITLGAALGKGRTRLPQLLAERIVYLSALPVWERYGRGWSVRIIQLVEACR